MKKGALLIGLIFIFSIYFASSQSFDVPIKKMTHYAGEYEIGSITYAQLIVYMASLSKELAIEMGATSQEHDPVLKQEQLEKALGMPTEETQWIWDENAQGERKSDDRVPAWRKIIFDGRELQIYLSAWPNLRDDKLIYRLHTDINFKSPGEEIDIKSEIEKIKVFAEDYASDSSKEKLENLAKESVSVEQTFNNNPYKDSVKCEEQMNELFGSENKRETQKIFRQEIEFFEEDKLRAIMELQTCDDCEWPWWNLNLRFDARGRFQYPEESRDYDGNSEEAYFSFTSEEFEEETRKMISEVRAKLQEKDYQSAMDKIQELRILTNAWNRKSNEVLQDEGQYRVDFELMTQEEQEECRETYCWIKKDQERIRAEKELKNRNNEERKQFYLELFSDYDKNEFYSSQERWEKRLVEEFKEFGEEICSNNLDDNNDQQIDCSDLQCGGKVCGYDTVIVEDETVQKTEQQRELYCIAGTCQVKQEIIAVAVCGNNICEENELESCPADCALCVGHEALACDGTAIFSGQNAQSCPLEPICLIEDLLCETDDDCVDPLCGDYSCVEETCKFTQLTECREPECVDGEEKVQNCDSGDRIVIEKCIEGIWSETGIECPVVEGEIAETAVPTEEIIEGVVEEVAEEIVGNACVVRSDCGNANDVCSNGNCVALPYVIEETNDEIAEDEIENIVDEMIEASPSPEVQEGSTPVTGNAVVNFFRSLITGFQAEGGGEGNSNPDSQLGNPETQQQSQPEQPQPELSPVPDFTEQRGYREREENEDRERKEGERRTRECNERCGRECYDRKVRPCVENYIREECGNELECDIDEVRVAGENTCKENPEVASCTTECLPKCLTGKETWIEPEREEHKQEKFVFTVGGACRQEKDRLDKSIWFGGWGVNFNDFHLIKEKYFTHGGTDWCERDYKNLIYQRQELEKSLDDEFTSWFFEKHLASSAENWQWQISGIFDLYWRLVDVSRQLAERAQCLGINELPPHNFINLKYESEYGGIEIWEDVKEADVFGDGQEVEIISPYMKASLFPSRDFFKLEMKKAMEAGRIPGPDEEESRNTPTEEQKQRLIEDGAFERIRDFKEKYGENLVIQFKDYNSDEIVFNVFIKINEEDIMYFEPMLLSEIPVEDYVKVEYDIDKLLDIVEYGESGRVEQHSPPWDKKPEVGFVKNVVDGVKMYFMFREMLNSAVVTPSDAESDATDFTRVFFEVVMGDGERREGPEPDELEGEQDDLGNIQEDN